MKQLELHGFKSFAKKSEFSFDSPVTAIVGPNGSGKSNIVESIRFVLGEQSIKSLRSASGKDLIFAGSKQIPKMSRASVTITFDNKDRIFQLSSDRNEQLSLDFDEIKISREVFPDGSNTYKINGQEVRMKDVIELIASINIGSSGHHIISQGEADRLLNANAKERKVMIEDALGLKLYHYRIKEAEKKLEKTQENLKETNSLRRELAPHLKFLKRQVEKIERAKTMREELRELYVMYLKREEALLGSMDGLYGGEKKELEKQIKKLDGDIEAIKKELDITGKTPEEEAIEALEGELQSVRSVKEDLARQLGRLEGMIELAQEVNEDIPEEGEKFVVFSELEEIVEEITDSIEQVLDGDDLEDMRDQLMNIKVTLAEFMEAQEDSSVAPTTQTDTKKLGEMQKTHKKLAGELQTIEQKEQKIAAEIAKLRDAIAESKKDVQKRERDFFELTTARGELVSRLNVLEIKIESLGKAKTDFDEELREAKALIGEEVMDYKKSDTPTDDVTRDNQEIERKKIERIKIKLEEIGGGSGADVMKEYDETMERDAFLEREIEDLEKSMTSLTDVINELKDRLEKEFTTGVSKINTQFQEFFVAMFGGGKASLKVVEIVKRKRKITDEEGNEIELDDEEEDDKENGIEIKVNLPRKKITHLEMLSGGERSLTSIALLFALSQVNPPPFLVLDETDAALDEANSKRYGDMLENLSKLSQLIVVTHNRETMSRANVLYGITIGSEGCSKLLSVKFDEASAYAK